MWLYSRFVELHQAHMWQSSIVMWAVVMVGFLARIKAVQAVHLTCASYHIVLLMTQLSDLRHGANLILLRLVDTQKNN